MIAQKYKDVPYVDGGRTMMGADCWGIVRLVLIQEYGVPWLPSWGRILNASHRVINAAYISSSSEFVRVDQPMAADVVCVFNADNECAHLGIVVPGDTGHTVLHTRPKNGVSTMPIARFERFYDHRIEYWRYAFD